MALPDSEMARCVTALRSRPGIASVEEQWSEGEIFLYVHVTEPKEDHFRLTQKRAKMLWLWDISNEDLVSRNLPPEWFAAGEKAE